MEVGNMVKVTLFKGCPGERVVCPKGEIIEVYDDPDHELGERYVTHYVVNSDGTGKGGGTYFRYEIERVEG